MSAHDTTRAWFVAIALACCAFANRASAAPELALDWQAPSECPGRAAVEQRIVTQLNRAPRDTAISLQVGARLARTERGYVLALRTVRGTERGERVLQAARCEELVDAAVLVLALILDEEPPVMPPSREGEAPQSARVPSEKTRAGPLSVRASGLVEAGALPRLTGGAELGLVLSWAKSHVELTGLWLPAVRSERASDGARVEVALWSTRIGYCHDLFGRRARVSGCGAVELGRLSGTGVGLLARSTRPYVWSAGFVSLRLTVPLHARIALVLEPALAVPFVRHQFVSSSANGERVARLHAPESTSRRATLGAQLSF